MMRSIFRIHWVRWNKGILSFRHWFPFSGNFLWPLWTHLNYYWYTLTRSLGRSNGLIICSRTSLRIWSTCQMPFSLTSSLSSRRSSILEEMKEKRYSKILRKKQVSLVSKSSALPLPTYNMGKEMRNFGPKSKKD